MSFVNLKVGTRLVLGFGLVLIMLALVAMIGISRLSGVNEITNRITTRDWIKAVLANDVIGLANDNARASYELFLLTEKPAIATTLERIDRNKKNITDKLDQLEGLIYLAEGRPDWPPSGRHANLMSPRLPGWPIYCLKKESVKKHRVS